MNLIDSAIRAVAPEYALKRAKARRALEMGDKIGFWRQGAQASSNRKMSGQSLSHPDTGTNNTDRVTLIREARHLEENNAIIASILRKYETFTVGRLTYIPRAQTDSFNRQIKAYVERWFKYADITGRHSFRALASLAVKSVKRDGDIGFIITETKEGSVPGEDKPVCPIRLQAIEADRIGSTWSSSTGTGKPFKKLKPTERDFSGVVVDQYGRPVRYRIYNRQDNAAALTAWKEVDAADFLHVFEPIRFDGYRGFSAFGSSVNDIKDIQEILAMEKITVKHLSSKTGFITGGDGTDPDDINMDGTARDVSDAGSIVKAIDPGAIERLPQGFDFKELDNNRPSPTFQGFLDTLTRWVALSFNLPYGLAYSWATQGTAIRMEAAQAAREFEQTQLYLEEKLLYPIIRRVLATGVRLGHLPPIYDFDAGEWRYPARVTADVGRESQADIEEAKLGLKSIEQIHADRGEDSDIVRASNKAYNLKLIEDAKELVKASGGELKFKEALWQLSSKSEMPIAEPKPEPTQAPAPAAKTKPKPAN